MISNERPFKLGYLRGLDGLRGVLILMVLVCHGGLLPNGYGFVAVNAFFVLSGFLITCLLVLEYDQSNDISLRRFYLRRALRLLPALVTMLFVFMVIAYLTDSRTEVFQEMHQALWALFYSTNLAQILQAYPVGHAEPFAHTWSLSLEEQFYFVWPLLLLFLLRRNSCKSLLCWIMLGVYLSVGTRILLYLGTNLSGRLSPLGGRSGYAGRFITSGMSCGRIDFIQSPPPFGWVCENTECAGDYIRWRTDYNGGFQLIYFTNDLYWLVVGVGVRRDSDHLPCVHFSRSAPSIF